MKENWKEREPWHIWVHMSTKKPLEKIHKLDDLYCEWKARKAQRKGTHPLQKKKVTLRWSTVTGQKNWEWTGHVERLEDNPAVGGLKTIR